MPLEPWHFDYFLGEEEAADLSGRALGRTLISPDQTPLGFGGAYFDKNAAGQTVAIGFFYGGPNGYFVRKYLPSVMRAMRDCAEILVGMGAKHVYAVADRRVPEACKFIEWMGGKRIEADDPHGPVYEIPLDKLSSLGR